MGYRTTLWMAAVLLLLAVYLVLVEFPQQRKKEEAERTSKVLLSVDQNAIRTIKVKSGDQETDLKKTGENQWMITRPLTAEADPSEVKNLIATATDLRFKRVIDEKNEDPAPFGLDHPVVTVILGLPDREETVIIGNDGPVANSLYVEQGNTRRVVLADQWIKGSLNRSLFDLRDKTVVSIDPDKITALQVTFPTRTLSFKKEGDRWTIHKPRAVEADRNRIDGLVRSLSNLRATAFTDTEKDKKTLQSKFKKTSFSVNLEAGDMKSSLSFYPSENKGSAYAVTTPDRPIYTVADSLLGDFKPDLFFYLDKHLLEFKKEDVARVKVRTPNGSYDLKKSDGTWSMEGETSPPDPDDVDHFLTRLENLTAQREPDPPVKPDSAAIDPPSSEVRLLDANNQPLATLGIGSEFKEMRLAKGAARLGVVLVDKNIMEDIPRKGELIRKAPEPPAPNPPPPAGK
jgi:hypothetical protein